MRQAHKVCAHVLDLLHIVAVLSIGHGGADAGMLLVAVGTADQYALAVHEETFVGAHLEPAVAEGLTLLVLDIALGIFQCDFDSVEMG